eukprot:945230-Pyramimonas_sp.AAC.1
MWMLGNPGSLLEASSSSSGRRPPTFMAGAGIPVPQGSVDEDLLMAAAADEELACGDDDMQADLLQDHLEDGSIED